MRYEIEIISSQCIRNENMNVPHKWECAFCRSLEGSICKTRTANNWWTRDHACVTDYIHCVRAYMYDLILSLPSFYEHRLSRHESTDARYVLAIVVCTYIMRLKDKYSWIYAIVLTAIQVGSEFLERRTFPYKVESFSRTKLKMLYANFLKILSLQNSILLKFVYLKFLIYAIHNFLKYFNFTYFKLFSCKT